MKLTRKEFEAQLALAKSLPAESRMAMITNLKSAQVYEVDEATKAETIITVEIVDGTPETKSSEDPTQIVKSTITVDEKMVEGLVKKELAKLNAKTNPIDQPETKSFKVPAEAKRYGTVKNFAPITRNGMDAEERAYALGTWSMACMGHAKSLEWCTQRGIEVKLQQETVNTAGGFSVPIILSADFIDLKEQFGVVRRLFGRYPMISDTLLINRRASGLTAYPIAEGQVTTESTMSIDQVRLTAKDWGVIARMTNQLNADSVMSWGDRLAYEIGYAFANKEDLCGFNGDGTSPYSGITGLTTQFTNKWTAGIPGTGIGLIKQGTSNTWAAMVMGDFDAVVGALPQYADTPNCVWVMHRTFYYTVCEKLIQAAGGVPAYEVRQGQRAPRPLFKGYPVEFAQVLPSTSTSGQVNAFLGDLSLGCAFGDRAQDSIDFSSQASVGGQSMWERNQMGVRGIERFDINVHDVGNGTTQAGPIVALANG